MTQFTLHPQLAADTYLLGKFPLCQLLLMNDKQFPWLILVPQVDNISEAYQLSQEQQVQLNKETVLVGKIIMTVFNGDKLNTAALGNLVPQLHIHQIVRYRNDIAWPHPVWGRQSAIPYPDHILAETAAEIQQALAEPSVEFTPC